MHDCNKWLSNRPKLQDQLFHYLTARGKQVLLANGYPPVTMTDSISGETFLVDFDDIDLMSGNLLSQILSLGKLLQS